MKAETCERVVTTNICPLRRGVNKINMEKELLRLLQQYHHYKFMSNGTLAWLLNGWYSGMDLGGFMQWLQSRENL